MIAVDLRDILEHRLSSLLVVVLFLSYSFFKPWSLGGSFMFQKVNIPSPFPVFQGLRRCMVTCNRCWMHMRKAHDRVFVLRVLNTDFLCLFVIKESGIGGITTKVCNFPPTLMTYFIPYHWKWRFFSNFYWKKEYILCHSCNWRWNLTVVSVMFFGRLLLYIHILTHQNGSGCAF